MYLVNGYLVDYDGKPIINANVTLESNPTIGANTTSPNGKFSFYIPNADDVLIVSKVGYESFKTTGRQVNSQVSFEMQEANINLDGIEITGDNGKSKFNWLALLLIAAGVGVAYYVTQEPTKKITL